MSRVKMMSLLAMGAALSGENFGRHFEPKVRDTNKLKLTEEQQSHLATFGEDRASIKAKKAWLRALK